MGIRTRDGNIVEPIHYQCLGCHCSTVHVYPGGYDYVVTPPVYRTCQCSHVSTVGTDLNMMISRIDAIARMVMDVIPQGDKYRIEEAHQRASQAMEQAVVDGPGQDMGQIKEMRSDIMRLYDKFAGLADDFYKLQTALNDPAGELQSKAEIVKNSSAAAIESLKSEFIAKASKAIEQSAGAVEAVIVAMKLDFNRKLAEYSERLGILMKPCEARLEMMEADASTSEKRSILAEKEGNEHPVA